MTVLSETIYDSVSRPDTHRSPGTGWNCTCAVLWVTLVWCVQSVSQSCTHWQSVSLKVNMTSN